MDLLFMYPFLRAFLLVCAVLCSLVSALLVIQLFLFRKIIGQSRENLGRLATAHTAVGSFLACVSILFAMAFWAGAFLVGKPVRVQSFSRVEGAEGYPHSPARTSDSRTIRSPQPAGSTWGGGTFRNNERRALPDGDGIIQGRILLDGKGIAGARIKLILDRNYHSPYATTDENGIYRIKTAKGKYTYNGWMLGSDLSLKDPLSGKVLIDDGLKRRAPESFDPDRVKRELDRETQDKINEIMQTYPPSEAADRIEELLREECPPIPNNDQHVLIVNDQPAEVPPLAFVTPLAIIYPPAKTRVAEDDLQIRWTPVPHAEYYDVQLISQEKREGQRPAYSDFTLFSEITGNSLSRERILSRLHLREDRRYLVEVMAYNTEGKKISQSYPTHSFEIK